MGELRKQLASNVTVTLPGEYQTVVIDPPWPIQKADTDGKGKGRGSSVVFRGGKNDTLFELGITKRMTNDRDQ
jgi:hypothetical protein